MKKAILIYSLILAIIAGVFYACEKPRKISPSNSNEQMISGNTQNSMSVDREGNGGSLPEIDKEKMHTLRMTIINMPLQQQREFFSRLGSLEKYGVWRDKWEQVMSISNWTVQQRQHLGKVNNLLTQNLFIENSDEIIFFNEHFKEPWRAKAEKLFSFAVLVQIVDRIEDVDPITGVIETTERVRVGEDCECNQDDDWCLFTTCSGGLCHVLNSGCGGVI